MSVVDVEYMRPICTGYYQEARATAVSLKDHAVVSLAAASRLAWFVRTRVLHMITLDPMVMGPLVYFFCCTLGPTAHHSNVFTSEPIISPIPESFHKLFPLSCDKQIAMPLEWDVPRHRSWTHGSITPDTLLALSCISNSTPR